MTVVFLDKEEKVTGVYCVHEAYLEESLEINTYDKFPGTESHRVFPCDSSEDYHIGMYVSEFDEEGNLRNIVDRFNEGLLTLTDRSVIDVENNCVVELQEGQTWNFVENKADYDTAGGYWDRDIAEVISSNRQQKEYFESTEYKVEQKREEFANWLSTKLFSNPKIEKKLKDFINSLGEEDE